MNSEQRRVSASALRERSNGRKGTQRERNIESRVIGATRLNAPSIRLMPGREA